MKKTHTLLLMLICCFALLAGTAMAQDHSGWGVSGSYGQSKDNIDIYRVGVVKDWDVKWLKNATGYVNGYFELSYNYWKEGGDETHGLALSPVFQYAFNPSGSTWYPYVEGGVGVTYIDEYFIGTRNLSSNFQFEDRIGVGFRFNRLDLSFRYMHYSNAGLKQPNEGIDIWIGSLMWFF